MSVPVSIASSRARAAKLLQSPSKTNLTRRRSASVYVRGGCSRWRKWCGLSFGRTTLVFGSFLFDLRSRSLLSSDAILVSLAAKEVRRDDLARRAMSIEHRPEKSSLGKRSRKLSQSSTNTLTYHRHSRPLTTRPSFSGTNQIIDDLQ